MPDKFVEMHLGIRLLLHLDREEWILQFRVEEESWNGKRA